ncbi:MAG: ypeA 2 [Verrucomicrobia bacterium]|nr:ypeA 2 [Verrucomicrobiota bacterium]
MDAHGDVVALWQRCEGIGLSEADSPAQMRTYLERNLGMSFVAAANSRIVGAVLCGHDGRRGYIHHLAVDPLFRRQGIGRLLIANALRALGGAGIHKCHIFIFSDNIAGMKFWKAEGWTVRSEIDLASKEIETSGSNSSLR